MIPSVKTIMQLKYFTGEPITRADAKRIRGIMEKAHGNLYSTYGGGLQRIDAILKGCGVEYIDGNGDWPSISYVNMGDTYDTTVMFVNGRFRIGSWGDIVERGDYD